MTMGEARIAHVLSHLLGDTAPFPGDESGGDLAGLPRQRCPDADIDRGSDGIDLGPGRQVPRRGGCSLEDSEFAGGVAGGAEAGEPGLAREIETAGLDRLGRRLKRRSQRDGLTDPRARAVGGREAHAHAIRALVHAKIA